MSRLRTQKNNPRLHCGENFIEVNLLKRHKDVRPVKQPVALLDSAATFYLIDCRCLDQLSMGLFFRNLLEFLAAATCNFGQNKWNIWTTPPPISMMPKWRVSCSFAPSSLLWGGWGIIVPFYTVQDCGFRCSTLVLWIAK